MTITQSLKLKCNAVFSLLSRHKYQLIAALTGILVFYLRAPDSYLHPQLWAEDGKVFFATAYQHNFSLDTLYLPYAGYFQLFPRLVSLTGYFVPLSSVPLAFSVAALAAQILPVIYIWSKRFTGMASSWKIKGLLTVLYLCLPYTQEISGNITNSQWYLALTAFIILFLAKSASRVVNTVDWIILVIAGLSGPFAIMLLPIVFAEWLASKESYKLKRLAIIGLCATAYVVNALFFQARGSAYLGASMSRLWNIVGGQVFGTALFGTHSQHLLLGMSWANPFLALLGTGFMIYMLVKGPRVLMLLVVYGWLILLAGMFFPTSSSSSNGLWYILQQEGATARYFFLLHLAFFAGLAWVLSTKRKLYMKFFCVAMLLLAFAIGIPRDFRHDPVADLHFQGYAEEFKRLPKGASERIPINPGPSWDITLVK